jgi:hypothetical protein
MRVFLSSRFEEHLDLRQALTKAFDRYGHQTIDLNDGRADDRSVRSRSFDELGRSDAVVLILGATYGTVVERGKSMTHLEFHRALALGKPIFAYYTTEPRGAAAANLQREVSAEVVYVNKVVDAVTEAAQSIVMDVMSNFIGATSDADVDPELAGGLAVAELTREADYLGFRADLDGTDRMDSPRSAIRAQAAGHAGLAFEALQLGHADVAMTQVKRAVELHPLEWVPAYTMAWLAARAERRLNRLAAQRAARRAVTVAQRAFDLAVAPRDRELHQRRLTASHTVVGRLAISLHEYGEARQSLDQALVQSGWSRPAMLQRLRVAALDEEDLDETRGLTSRFLRTYPREFWQLLQSNDLLRRRRAIEEQLVDEIADVSRSADEQRKRRYLRLNDALGPLQADYNTTIQRGRASLQGLMQRSAALAGIMALEQGQPTLFSTSEDIGPVENALSDERWRLSTFIGGFGKPAPGPLDVSRLTTKAIESLETLTRADRDDSAVLSRLDIDDRQDHSDRTRLCQSALPSMLAVAAVTALAFVPVLIFAGWHVGTSVAVAIAIAAWICRRRLAPAAEWALTSDSRAQRRRRAKERQAVEARVARRGEERRRLEARLWSLQRLTQVERRLAAIASLQPRDAPVALDRAGISAAVLCLVNDKNEFARWAAVVAPQHYVPRRRCRQGAITRIGPDRAAIGGITPTTPTDRLVRCVQPPTVDRTIVVSDLAIFGHDSTQQHDFALFEQFVLSRFPKLGQRRAPWPPPAPPRQLNGRTSEPAQRELPTSGSGATLSASNSSGRRP